MSMPNIPDVNANINLNSDDVINLLFASIAFEELGQSHLINAEGEKIQYVLGTLENLKPLEPATIEDLQKINTSVKQMVRNIIKNQMLLQFKLEDVIDFVRNNIIIYLNIATVTAFYNDEMLINTDRVYYYSKGGNS